MISQLEGIVKFKGGQFVIIDVHGVGYRIFVAGQTLRKIPKSGEKIILWTHLYVRENALELYGFLHYAELEFFNQLIQISGIGPKSGLAVLAVAPIDVLRKAIAAGETSYLTKVSGIGHRLAEKIVLELKDKMAAFGVDGEDIIFKAEEDALEALCSLGYSLKESREALRQLPKEVNGVENLVREALRNINKK